MRGSGVNTYKMYNRECDDDIREHMLGHLARCDEEYGRRVAVGLARRPAESALGTAASD